MIQEYEWENEWRETKGSMRKYPLCYHGGYSQKFLSRFSPDFLI